MFQSNLGGKTSEQLDGVVDAMKASSVKIRSLICEKFDDEWDMSAYYIPNHACIWNKIANMQVRCQIMEKDDSIAVVQFEFQENNIDTLMSRVYRLEDLTRLTA